MKLSHYFYLLLVIVVFQACHSENPEIVDDFSFQITGIKESVSYEFTSKSGRTVSDVPDDVYNLTVLIFNSSNELVHERRYYAYDHDSDIPDTLHIPNFPAGEYQVTAITADFYEYYYDLNGDSTNGENIGYDLILPEWTTSESPIYVGYESFTLDAENEIVEINMSNISARVEFRIPEDQNMHERELGLGMMSINSHAFDIVKYEFIDRNEAYFWTSLNEWHEQTKQVIYVLPQTLNRLNIHYWDYSGFNFNQEVFFSDPIQLRVGDAISFTIDIDALVDGGGTGVFNFEDIKWNDLGGVSIP